MPSSYNKPTKFWTARHLFKIIRLALALAFLGIILVSCNSSSGTKVLPTEPWPPKLTTSDAKGTASFTTPDFLIPPADVKKVIDSLPAELRPDIAKTPPVIELAYHGDLPDAALNGMGWSSWGDICLASDGKVYSGIGSHGGDEKGICYMYCWDPALKELKRIAELNQINGAGAGDIHFSKIHAGTFEGVDKKIYFTGTLNAGAAACSARWTSKIKAAQLYQYDPETGKSSVYADFPDALVTATSLYDRNRNIFYCGLEGDSLGDRLGAFDMAARKWVYISKPRAIEWSRNFMIDNKGNVYFNGREDSAHFLERLKNSGLRWYNGPKRSASMTMGLYTTLWKYDPDSKTISSTNSSFNSNGIRSSTREGKDGFIYGSTYGEEYSYSLFRYAPAKDELQVMGSNFLVKGEYVTVCTFSPDEKYMYYLPGAHGSAGFIGSPVIQYNIKTGRQKILVFLSEPFIQHFGYDPGGTYGIKITPDGSTLYVNLNGSAAEAIRPKGNRQGFGLTSFAAIHIPESERTGD